MATPTREALHTYMSVTGASQSLALLKLQEHGNDLSMAVNAHFAADGVSVSPHPVNPHNNSTQPRAGHRRILPILSAARSFKPSSLLDPNYRRDFFNQIGITRNNTSPPPADYYRPPLFPNYATAEATHNHPGLYGNNYFEEQMIQAAIQASKQETSSSSAGLGQVVRMEDDELNRAIALSIETAEKEHASLVGGQNSSSSRSRDTKERSIKPRHPDEAGHAEGSGNQFNPDIQIGQPDVLSDEQSRVKKVISLPQEPLPDDENAINFVVRMPDGSRHGRRFLKSDKLQCLFHFIDINGLAEPGSYRLVDPYPRRAWDASDSSTFSELGLTNKQEALFLELI